MNNFAAGLIKAYLKNVSADEAKKIAVKLGRVKSAEDVAAIFAEYKIDFDKEACANIYNEISKEKSKELSDEDLELVSGGCSDTGC